jgi:enoyl-CoA hydratase/carnithine racemase
MRRSSNPHTADHATRAGAAHDTALGAAQGAALSAYTAQHFDWKVSDGVAALTFDRPDKKNALTFASYAEARDVMRALALASDVKAVVITGAGNDFCSGGDVFEIIEPLTRMKTRELLQFTQMTGDLVKAMRACPQPLIAAVDGVCAGAGAIIAMACDLRVGTPRAKTYFLFNRVGLAGSDMGACALLPRIIGQGRAAELLYLGRAMSAQEAERWGWFNRVVEPAQLLDTARELADAIAEGPTFANGITKKMLHLEWAMSLDAAIDAEAQAQALCMTTADFRRAFDAFASKAKPKFEGD